MARAAIVTTLRLPDGMSQPLRSFLDYHLAIGFQHIFLFFDDPNDESIDIAERYGPQYVTVFRRSDELVCEQAERCSQYTRLAPYMNEVPARQTLNAELAMILASEKGLTWLLHIDIDELFYSEAADVSTHFAWLDEQGVYSMTYMNHEAVPESLEIVDYFQDVTLFRRHFSALNMDTATREAVSFWQRRTNHGQYFLVYDNGKSACRVGVGAYPKDVHSWQLPIAYRDRERIAIADVRNLDPAKLLVIDEPCILHFDWLLQKYKMLGDFESAWFGGNLPIAPSFHLDARNVVQRQSDARLDPETFYREQVLFNHGGKDDATTVQHLNLGVIFRNCQHTRLIAHCKSAQYNIDRLREAGRSRASDKLLSDEMPLGTEPLQTADQPSATAAVADVCHAPSTIEGFDRAWIIAQATQQYLVDR